ncbi:MAG: hypothetical protein ACK2TW_01815 [Anaerolineales bacterium]
MPKKDKKSSSEFRNLRVQQIIFILIGVIIILSMVLALVAK